MEYHPYSHIWPLLDGADFEELKADIKANGQRLPVLTYNDMILDGRNRDRACEQLGFKSRYEQADVTSDDEALNLVVSLNNHRRHLSLEHRAFAAEALATLRNGSNQFQAKNKGVSQETPSNSGTKTFEDAAEQVGVSVASAKRARAIRTHGDEADVADVINGKTTLAIRARELTTGRHQSKKKQPTRSNVGQRTFTPNNNLSTLRALTREQVDPEFKGTPTEFMDRFGHVQTTTAVEKASAHLNTYATYMRTMAKAAQGLPSWPTIDEYWLDKLREPNRHDIAKLTEALEYLRPIVSTAEALLACAVAAEKRKQS